MKPPISGPHVNPPGRAHKQPGAGTRPSQSAEIGTIAQTVDGTFNIANSVVGVSGTLLLADMAAPIANKAVLRWPGVALSWLSELPLINLIPGVKSLGSGMVKSSHHIEGGIEAVRAAPISAIGERTYTGGLIGGAADLVMMPFAAGEKWLQKTFPSFHAARAKNASAAASGLHGDMTKHLELAVTEAGEHAFAADITKALGELPSVDHITPKAMEKLAELADKATEHNLPKANMALKNAAAIAQEVVWTSSNARNWMNGATAAAVPGVIARTPIHTGVMNTVQVGGAATQGYYTFRSGSKEFQALREMYADMTGTSLDKVSNVTLLFGKVPKPIAEARSSLMWEFGTRSVLSAANIGLNTYWAIRGKFNTMAWLGLSAAEGSVGMLAGHSSLEKYSEMKQTLAARQPISAELYKDFIGAAVPQIRDRKGIDSNYSKALAVEYAQEQATPARILQESQDGRLDQRVERMNAIAEAHKAKVKAAQEQAAQQAHAAEPNGKQVSHVDALNAPKPSHPPQHAAREVVGKHTQQMHEQAAHAATQQPTQGVV